MIKLKLEKTEFVNKLEKFEVVEDGIFVYLYKIAGCYYVYDVVSSEIMKVSKSLYDLLEAINIKSKPARIDALCNLSTKIPYEKIVDGITNIENVRKNHSVFISVPKDFKIVLNRNALEKNIALEGLILEVTYACNFRCSYCSFSGNYQYERTFKSANMPTSTAIKAVDYFFDNRYENSPEPWISIYGGEPLLQKDLILDVIKYAQKKFQKVKFNIQTNGYLLDYEFYEKIKGYSVTLSISIDGPKQIHDRCRVLINKEGTFDKILSNLEKIANDDEEFIKKRVNIVYTMPSLHNLPEISNFHYGHPILRNCNTNLNIVNDYNLNPNVTVEELCKVDSIEMKNPPDLNELYNRYKKALKNNKTKGLHFENKIFGKAIEKSNKKTPLEKTFTARGLCSIGKKRLAVDPLGNFRICERSSRMPIIGNLTEGINWEAINKMEKDYIQKIQPCYECWALVFCTICWAKLYLRDKDIIDIDYKEKYCDEIRQQVAFNLKAFSNLSETLPEEISEILSKIK